MDEINELLEKQSELIDKLGAKAKAYDYILESLTECWEEYISEGELIEEDFRSGEHGGLLRKWNEINIKQSLSVKSFVL